MKVRAVQIDSSGAKAPEGYLISLSGTAEEAAEKGRTNGEDEENHPAAAKAGAHFAPFAARLKPCPFKTAQNREFFRSLFSP
jgi:hypothetical protein